MNLKRLGVFLGLCMVALCLATCAPQGKSKKGERIESLRVDDDIGDVLRLGAKGIPQDETPLLPEADNIPIDTNADADDGGALDEDEILVDPQGIAPQGLLSGNYNLKNLDALSKSQILALGFNKIYITMNVGNNLGSMYGNRLNLVKAKVPDWYLNVCPLVSTFSLIQKLVFGDQLLANKGDVEIAGQVKSVKLEPALIVKGPAVEGEVQPIAQLADADPLAQEMDPVVMLVDEADPMGDANLLDAQIDLENMDYNWLTDFRNGNDNVTGLNSYFYIKDGEALINIAYVDLDDYKDVPIYLLTSFVHETKAQQPDVILLSKIEFDRYVEIIITLKNEINLLDNPTNSDKQDLKELSYLQDLNLSELYKILETSNIMDNTTAKVITLVFSEMLKPLYLFVGDSDLQYVIQPCLYVDPDNENICLDYPAM